MDICWFGFAGKLHSWAHVAQNISRQLIKMGHNVDIFSTNGIEHFPDDLKPNLIGYIDENEPSKIFGRLPKEKYDCQLSYTVLKNFSNYFTRGTKNRFGIWCYEWSGKNVLPSGFAKHYKACDKLLPPSMHAKQVFIDSGIPESHIEVIPHGVDDNFLSSTTMFKLNTDKKFKVLANIAQMHDRKNVPAILDAWGKAFNKNDDVALILKISKKKSKSPMEINFDSIYKSFKEKYKNHAQVVIVDYFIDDISSLYRACNAVISLSFAESFLLPALEGLASKKIVIAGQEGGHVDFCNKNNSLLVSGKNIRANPQTMYWEPKNNAIVFSADTNHAAEQLRFAYKNEEMLLKQFDQEFDKIREYYTWENVANKIMNLADI